MSFGSVNNDYKQHIWGAAAYSSQQAATIGREEKPVDFKNALEEAEQEEESTRTFGFGSLSEGGKVSGSITQMVGMASDMISQLQFSLLKNNSTAMGNNVNSRISPVGF